MISDVEYLTRFQDPQQADTIMKVQAELDETKIVLHKTIESVLQRGEKLDNLVERSDALSAQSRLFYKTAKKQVRTAFQGELLMFRTRAVLSCRMTVCIWSINDCRRRCYIV